MSSEETNAHITWSDGGEKFYIRSNGHALNRPTSNLETEEWIRGAAEDEDAAGCDISAGLKLGKRLSDYLKKINQN